MKKNVYQTPEYKRALLADKKKIINFSQNLFGYVKTKKFPIFKNQKTLETRGLPEKKDYKIYKLKSKKYFYDVIMPPVLGKYNDLNSKFKRIENSTILVSLKEDKEQLWKNLEKKSARWGVKTAEKNRLTFGIAKNHELKEFYKLYFSTSKEGDFKPKSLDFVKLLRDTEISKLFLVRKKTKIVCGGLVLIDKAYNYSILDLTASSEEGQKLQAMPFFYWNLILQSKALNLDFFDLGGYDSETEKGTKMYNINKFKRRFGGKIYVQPIYTRSWKYYLLRKFNKWIKKNKLIKN